MWYGGIESWKIKSLNGCYYRQWLGTETLYKIFRFEIEIEIVYSDSGTIGLDSNITYISYHKATYISEHVDHVNIWLSKT